MAVGVLSGLRNASVRLMAWAVAGLAAAILGCGGENITLGKVSGTVTLDGQPVTSGIIHFMPQSGPAATGVIDDQGQYRLTTYSDGDGAVIGSHTIYFSPVADESHMAGYTEADYAAGKPPPEAPAEEFLPAKYLSPSSSGLSHKVTRQSTTHDVRLTSAAP